MRVSVFGMGYVGAVSAACLAADGHTVIGVDPNHEKLDILISGRGPVIEPGLDDLVARGFASGSFRVTDNPAEAIANSDVALICVGTPSAPNGSLDLTHVRSVAAEIGFALKDRVDTFTVVLRSTVLPGTTRDVLIPELEAASGKKANIDFEVCFNPEFLRESTSIADYYDPPKIVVGTDEGKPSPTMDELYGKIDAPRVAAGFEVAEMVKYVDNSWHALKVAFANEVGRIGQTLHLDSREVMDIFIQDTKLNISPKYLRPGTAYGGSCLPKDVAALRYRARELDLEVPVLSAISASNQLQIDLAIRMIEQSGSKRVGILGLSFKAGTDDLRHSPTVDVVERLIGKGFQIRIHDPNVQLAALVGANKGYILEQIPHISSLLVPTAEEAVTFGDTVVVATAEPGFVGALDSMKEDQVLIDLVSLPESARRGDYRGIAW